jgi:hypothetical protein
MPRLDFALLADYVRPEGGVAHVISAGIDTVFAPVVPTGHNLGLLFRVEFTRQECGRPHRIEIVFQGEDGDVLTKLSSVVTPEWKEDVPIHWRVGVMGGINFGVPLPRYGLYAFEVIVNDENRKTLNLRVLPVNAAGETPALPPGEP